MTIKLEEIETKKAWENKQVFNGQYTLKNLTNLYLTNMSYIVVDVESDGGIIGENSMVCFGAVIVDKKLDKTFYGRTAPISDKYNPEALAVSGFSRIHRL